VSPRLRVLVLGAGGFIGRRVVAALAVEPWATPVAAVHRAPPAHGDAEIVQLDAADRTALQWVLRDIDAVVNCIAGSARTIVATARTLFDEAAQAPSRPRVVHLSTMAVYGPAVGLVDEDGALHGDDGAYAAAKVEAERCAAGWKDVVTLRPGCVYGPGSAQWSERIARLLRAGRVGDLGAAGDGACNLVHVDDVVAAVLAALRRPRLSGHAFNLGSPQPPTWNEYFLAFARALGAVPVRRIPARRLALETRLWAPPLRLAEIAARLARLGGDPIPPPIPPSLLRLWGRDLRLNVRKAEDMLGMAWTPLDAGLRATAAQLRAA
jgi:2-alkyl-3-oxoalkanoate reductase